MKRGLVISENKLNWILFSVLICLCMNVWAERPPNVIIIYSDDVGYGDVGVYGSEMIPTPNIDRLASEGIRFTDGHCTAATCSPSRFSMLTGIHDFRHRIGILSPTAPLCIPTDILTMPKMFKNAGYVTGVIGKWHLGIGESGTDVDWNGHIAPGPIEVGFDQSFVIPSTNDRVPCVYLDGHRVLNLDPEDPLYISNSDPIEPSEKTANSTLYPIGTENPESMTYYGTEHQPHMASVINGIGRIGYMVGGKSALWNDEDMADVFVEQTKLFIEKNRDKPFFLYFSSQDIHAPRTPHKRFQGKTSLSYRGDAMVQLDWSTGEIMKLLEDHGLVENTIVIFSSDNGPVYNDGGYFDGTVGNGESYGGHDASGPFRGGKYKIFEGGTRVPFIIRWPGKIPPNVESDALVSQIDLMASLSEVIGVELDHDEGPDSRNTLDAFLGQDGVGQSFIIESAFKRVALRQGDWKYVARLSDQLLKGEMLFNLANDVAEEHNLLKENPEKALAMSEKLAALIKNGVQLRTK